MHLTPTLLRKWANHTEQWACFSESVFCWHSVIFLSFDWLQNAFSTQRNQQPLQRYPSVRSYTHTAAPLMSVSSEGSPVSSFSTKLNRADYDSGIYLNEAGMNSSVQSLLSHSLVGRSNSANVNLPNGQDNLPNHPFVGKTASSPIPEQSVSHTRSTMIPLSAVLSAPAPSNQSYYSDFQPNYASHQLKPTLSNSGDENQEAHGQGNYMDRSLDPFSSDMGTNETSKRLMYSSSLRTPTTRTYGNNANNDLEGVSPYLGIDGNSNSVRNTFTQANSGMRGKWTTHLIDEPCHCASSSDVPKWLKNLRLHKYAFFFSQMSYDQMMNLTIDQLKEGKITDGACTKILLNIKKLKERPALLQKCLIEIDHDQIEMKVVLQQLRELMLTPIRAKQNEPKSDNDEDLPKLIMQVLEKGRRESSTLSRDQHVSSCSLSTIDSEHIINGDSLWSVQQSCRSVRSLLQTRSLFCHSTSHLIALARSSMHETTKFGQDWIQIDAIIVVVFIVIDEPPCAIEAPNEYGQHEHLTDQQACCSKYQK